MDELYGRLLLQKELTKLPDKATLFDGMQDVSKTVMRLERFNKDLHGGSMTIKQVWKNK